MCTVSDRCEYVSHEIAMEFTIFSAVFIRVKSDSVSLLRAVSLVRVQWWWSVVVCAVTLNLYWQSGFTIHLDSSEWNKLTSLGRATKFFPKI